MSSFASSPLEKERQARMTLEALRRTKCLEASRPRPMFEPVTMMVWPVKDVVCCGRGVHCEVRCLRMVRKDIVVAFQVYIGILAFFLGVLSLVGGVVVPLYRKRIKSSHRDPELSWN